MSLGARATPRDAATPQDDAEPCDTMEDREVEAEWYLTTTVHVGCATQSRTRASAMPTAPDNINRKQ